MVATVQTGERHFELLEGLLAELDGYSGELDRELIVRAFTFAAAAHEGQQRRSGEPFIMHPVGVATICAGLRLDEQTIAAALLHDVVEDTGTELATVREEFGEEIAALVDGVTKLTRVQFQSREQAEAENYRKMVVAMAADVRVILVKLADRLHNLRTIEYLGRQKQVQKAKEALEVYAPLAHRLGITRSSGSSRTSRSRRCTRASSRRSSRWWRSGARIAKGTSQKRLTCCSASS